MTLSNFGQKERIGVFLVMVLGRIQMLLKPEKFQIQFNNKRMQRVQYFYQETLKSIMQQGQRKFYVGERSIPKQTRPSYQYPSNLQKETSPQYLPQYTLKRESVTINSDVEVKNNKEDYFRTINERRKNEGYMSNLKSQLQNLKNEVNKLISKDPARRTPQKERFSVHLQRSEKKKLNYISLFEDELTDKDQDFNDAASISSVTTEKVLNEPLRRLQKKFTPQNYDSGYYMQLQNDLLKSQIKNLKNKYVSKKRELTEKCELLEKKNQFLQISLQKSEQVLSECRKTLEMEIMMIKRQITFKTEIKPDLLLPESDRVSEISSQGNQMLQQKLKKVYDQISQKNKQINNMSIELGDVQALLDQKKFQLRKQQEKNTQLSKQLQLSKRQNARLQLTLENELTKSKQLGKENEIFKSKNKQLLQQIYKKEQIVAGSEQYENRMAEELESYKKKEDELQKIFINLKNENRKLHQLISTSNDEIKSLKNSHEDSVNKITQLSKKLKQEQHKAFQRQEYYRKVNEEQRKQHEENLKIIQQQYEHQATLQSLSQEQMNKEQSREVNKMLKEKDRQVNKWKAEYKILKLKYEEKYKMEKEKVDQNQHYYKGFIEYKNKVELLEQTNKLLQNTVEDYMKQLTDKETKSIKTQLQHQEQLQAHTQQKKKLQHLIQTLKDDLELTKSQLVQTIARNEDEIKYRQQLQFKIEKRILQKHSIANDSEEEQNILKPQEIQEETLQENIENASPDRKNSAQKREVIEEDNMIWSTPTSETKQQKLQIKLKTQKFLTQNDRNSQQLQFQGLIGSIDIIKKRIAQQDEKLTKNVKQLKNKDIQINKLKKQIRELLENHEKQLNELKFKYTADRAQVLIKETMESKNQLKLLFEKQIQVYKEKQNGLIKENIQMKAKISKMSKELLDLRQETKSISHLYNVKCSEVELVLQKNLQQLVLKDRKIDELHLFKQQHETKLLSQISHLKDQISTLRLDIKQITSLNQKIEVGSFNDALKNQIQSTKILREELGKKNEQVFKLRDNYTFLRSQYDNLRSEAQIEKLKNLSQRKNLQVQYQIQQQNIKNKLSNEEKRVSSLQQKISIVIQQNRKKDTFIQSYIMGKKLPQTEKDFLIEFTKGYELCLNGSQINQKLRADCQEIEKMAAFNYKLLKDMAEMKEKILLYQTIEGEISFIHDSIQAHSTLEGQKQNNLVNQSTSQFDGEAKESLMKFQKVQSLIEDQE